MYIFVIRMIPAVEHCEVCYKTQRLAALPWQLQGGGKGTTVRACLGPFGPSLGGPSRRWGWQGGLCQPWEDLLFPRRASRQRRGEEQGLLRGGPTSDAWCVRRGGMGIWPLHPTWDPVPRFSAAVPQLVAGGVGRGPGRSRGPAGLGRPPGAGAGSGCSRWGRRVAAGRQGGVGKGSARRLATSLGSPAWKVRNPPCAARPALAPGLHRPPEQGCGKASPSHRSTALSAGEFQPLDTGARRRAGCAVLHARPARRGVAARVCGQRCLGAAGRVDVRLPTLPPEHAAARRLSARSFAQCWTPNPG